jgi:hypothetical protein
MKTKTKIEVDIPVGYEFVRFGNGLPDEFVLNECGGVVEWHASKYSPHLAFIIVRKKEPRTWWLDVDACGRVNQVYVKKPNKGTFCFDIVKVQEVIE